MGDKEAKNWSLGIESGGAPLKCPSPWRSCLTKIYHGGPAYRYYVNVLILLKLGLHCRAVFNTTATICYLDLRRKKQFLGSREHPRDQKSTNKVNQLKSYYYLCRLPRCWVSNIEGLGPESPN